jgi:8-oxo-dGTP diphosphatase
MRRHRRPCLGNEATRPDLPQNGSVSRSIDVVGAVIVRDGLVYCVQRGLTASLPGMWEFPGGKIEPGEDEVTALTREIHEELLCRVSVGQKVTTTSHDYDFGTVRLTTYYCALAAGEPSLTEHVAELWLRPDQLTDLVWAPADVPAVEDVVRHLAAATNE